MESAKYPHEGMWNSVPSQMVQQFKETTTYDLTNSGKLERNSDSLAVKKPKSAIDLPVEGVPQDAISKGEEQMKETNKKLEK